MVQSPLAPSAKKSNGVAIAMIAASLFTAIGLGAVGVTLMAKKPAAAAEAPHVDTVPPPVAPPTAPPAETATPAPPVVAVADLVVSVKVPKSSTVEVDGKKVSVENGVIELTGPLGSVSSVHVVTSTGDTTQNVAITGNGALPAKITVSKNHGTVGAGAVAAPSATGVNVQPQVRVESSPLSS